MFTINHFIWLAISLVVISSSLVYLMKNKPSLKQVLNVCCVLCVLSEVVKTFSSVRLIPSADGSMYFPYIESKHIPLHLCSLQIILIFYARFTENKKIREIVLAFMYPTTILGAALALAMPSIFSGTIEISQAFTHPLAYQFFLFHDMLIVLGIYIFISKEIDLKPKHYFSTIAMLATIGFISIYFNSIFGAPVYENDVLQYVEYTTNFFFTYKPPINIPLTKIGHWYLYFGVISLLAIVLIGVMYIPVFKKKRFFFY